MHAMPNEPRPERLLWFFTISRAIFKRAAARLGGHVIMAAEKYSFKSMLYVCHCAISDAFLWYARMQAFQHEISLFASLL